MICPKCQVEVTPNSKFCGKCGFVLQASSQQSWNPQTPPQGQQSGYGQSGYGQSYGEQGQQHFGGQYGQSQQSSYQSRQVGYQSNFRFDEDGRGRGRGYTWEVRHAGSFALAVINLEPEQSICAEAGAMVSMSGNVELQSQMKGGLFGALKRVVGGESAFVSTFTARGGPGEVTLAPGAPGDIVGIEMQNQRFLVQSSSYLAGDVSLQVDTKFGGLKSFIASEGLFLLEITGTGLLLISSFGAIYRKALRPGERYVVDTGHLVAWEAHIPYQLRKAARGFFRSFLSGEGWVAEFTGPGEILIQTRNLAAFAGLLKPFFPNQGGSGVSFDI